MTSEHERWKSKYLAKLDEVERLETTHQNQSALLQRLLVRISLAAQGNAPLLDAELDTLRTHLRQGAPDPVVLEKQLSRIDKQVLELDDRRADASGNALKAMQDLIEALLACDLSRSHRRALKNFSRELSKKLQDLAQLPQMLQEYSRLHTAALQELLAQQQGESAPGFFGKLFGQKEASAGQPSSGDEKVRTIAMESEIASPEGQNAPERPDEESRSDAEGLTTQVFGEQYLTADDASQLDLDSPPAVEGEEGSFANIAGHVSMTLAHLLGQLHLPATLAEDANSLREKMLQGIFSYELPDVLDEVADLVIIAFGRGQQEFEHFLQSLDARLSNIHEFLDSSQNSESESRHNNAELQRVVREQVSSMQANVQEAQDVEGLKTSVQTHLDRILGSLAVFSEKEERREEKLAHEVDQLKTKLALMEQDSAELQEKLEAEKAKAQTDVLTGLPNRLAYEQRSQTEYERWKRYGNKLSLVVMDIDHFKRINDTYGHQSGDKVIQLIAKETSRRIRATDFVARYGGEEFALLFPETKGEIAAEVMNTTREMIARLPFHFRKEAVKVTVSAGVCELTPGITLEQAFARADKALYQAKQSGRNAVVLATPEGSSQEAPASSD